MFTRRVRSGDASKLFIVMRNASAVDAPIGGAAHLWCNSATLNDGQNFTYLWTTSSVSHCRLVGIVANSAIPAGKHGVLQCYGHCDKIAIRDYGDTDWDWTSLQDRVLMGAVNMATDAEKFHFSPYTKAVLSTLIAVYGVDVVVHPVTLFFNDTDTNQAVGTGYARAFIRGL